MSADARILGIFALAAGGRVQVEAGVNGFRIGGDLDLHDRGEIVAGGERGVGEQDVAGFGERELGRGGAVAGGHGHDLVGGGDGFAVFADEGDLDLALGSDEELGVRLDDGEQASLVGAGGDFLVGVGDSDREGERGEREEADDGVFHDEFGLGKKLDFLTQRREEAKVGGKVVLSHGSVSSRLCDFALRIID